MSKENDYSYIVVWAKNTELFNLVRCDNKTYKREIVASFDELTETENKDLAQFCADSLNKRSQKEKE